MELARYFVSPSSEGWIVVFEGARLGAFESQAEAVEAARQWAAFWCRSGHDGDVFIEDEDGALTQLALEAERVPVPPEVPRRALSRLRRQFGQRVHARAKTVASMLETVRQHETR